MRDKTIMLPHITPYGRWPHFRMSVAQQEASRWWDAPTTTQALSTGLSPSCLWPQNFWVIRKEKTLALARVLQTCAEASAAKTGILYTAVRELQQCMSLLMTLNGDDVMEASLLRPVEEELRPFPTPKEEPASWAKEMDSQECQALLPNK